MLGICFHYQLHRRIVLSQFLFAITLITCSCTSTGKLANKEQYNRLKFLSEYDIPHNTQFQHTTVGGLSGIDYDKEKNIYYIISDDRSERNNARFYKTQIFIDNNKIDSVVFIETIFLKDKKSDFYPGANIDPHHTPDPEALRYNPGNDTYTWSSEGERIIREENSVLEDPSVTEINNSGNYIDTFLLPAQMHMSKEATGPRRNSVFEGLTFANNYKTLFVSVEEPLYNDGLGAGLHDSTGLIRIIKFDVATKKEVAQYAYKIDGVAHPPAMPGSFIINGVTDILSINKNKLLAVERSYSTGRPGCTIKIYLANFSKAQNIRHIPSLRNSPIKKMAAKKLLLNMDDLGIYIDNIEGVSFGPDLTNGHKTLVFVSDNNFDSIQKTQLLLFEIE